MQLVDRLPVPVAAEQLDGAQPRVKAAGPLQVVEEARRRWWRRRVLGGLQSLLVLKRDAAAARRIGCNFTVR